ncbi:cellulose biosynthesis cyclic di-GMP-binding regulatory protein BcsB [Leptolyngbya sp. FACHB-36]|uniref:cellulose biosynthesis cyclic di-GMP-binding regulatory protein BcsB n=1 Tax=Leptolyngbya sp. FACHB-36 TaxID=2692808 RepID=UPI0016801F5C|nr:cellulose biosynthesis cyclic di-GMP-binding regulatory protein BcsB [Leptolyngbya sp. FACHB-36]MBD2022062.1 cellulose biosynthesis cyclic di-GMP-binding regulatory protein BcsB [Leptolyngbya sp. FACHB-36]
MPHRHLARSRFAAILVVSSLIISLGAHAQTGDFTPVPPAKRSIASPVKPQTASPQPGAPMPTVNPLAAGQYVLEFSRSPIVGHRLRLQGIYDEARLQFTRPHDWQAKSAKIMLRYRHSPALYATRSNLTVLVNGASVGSLPLNRKQGELGTAVYDIPPRILQDYNEVLVTALQNNSPTCTQDPFDPSLWTEILPDSKLTFDVQPQPIGLDFSRYPYPVFDTLSLEPNRIAYRLPEQVDEAWLTTAARLQTSLGRLAQYRPMDTRLLKSGDALQPTERLVIIGTPKNQPALASLNLPLPLKDNQIRDEKQQPLPPDVGVLMLTTSADGDNLVLVATGNGPEGVAKAVQFLAQARDRQIGTGRAIVVKQVDPVPTPPVREWLAYLPTTDTFQLKDLRDYNNQPLADVTLRGADAPIAEFDFRALPDDRFESGNQMELNYSYSAQVNPLTSLVEVQLDGIPVTSKRLDKEQGALRETLQIPLPEQRIKPFSKLQVRFQLDPRERRSCNRATDQQLWATVHADTRFNLKRQTGAQVPNLRLLQAGYPFAAPQDLSRTAIAVPEKPSSADLLLMLEFAERMGRVSRADSVKLDVYRANQLPEAVRKQQHLVAIGTQAKFPLPQAFQSEGGFSLQDLFSRRRDQGEIQPLPDGQGVVKEIVSPWNPDRVLLTLSAQTDEGLAQVRDLLQRDDLFFQLREDTVLVKANTPNPSAYDPQAYTLEFLQQARRTRELSEASLPEQVFNWLRVSWLTLAPAMTIAALLLYGVFQTYLKRVARYSKK